MWEIARLILMFLKHDWLNNYRTFGPWKCSLGSTERASPGSLVEMRNLMLQPTAPECAFSLVDL